MNLDNFSLKSHVIDWELSFISEFNREKLNFFHSSVEQLHTFLLSPIFHEMVVSFFSPTYQLTVVSFLNGLHCFFEVFILILIKFISFNEFVNCWYKSWEGMLFTTHHFKSCWIHELLRHWKLTFEISRWIFLISIYRHRYRLECLISFWFTLFYQKNDHKTHNELFFHYIVENLFTLHPIYKICLRVEF